MDYYTIFDNFWRGFWQEQGDRPNNARCNLGRFQPRAVAKFRGQSAADEIESFVRTNFKILRG